MVAIRHPQFGFAVVRLQGLMQGNGTAPEEEAIVISHSQIGGGEILTFCDMLCDEGEDILFVKETCIERGAEGAGEMIAG